MSRGREAVAFGAGLLVGSDRLRGWLGRLGKKALLAVVFACFVAYGWLVTHPMAALLIGLLILGLVVASVLPQVWEWRDRRSPSIRRTRGAAWWVYRIYEYRDVTGRLLTQDAVRRGAAAVRHLVYIGKTNDFDARMSQHRADKPWWHDELSFELGRQHFSEHAALRDEARQIAKAAAARRLEDRPRENKALNPSHSPRHSARMRALATAGSGS